MDWTRSGEIMFMVILGGATYLCGPVIGALVFILLEHLLSEITVYWHLPFGLLLITSVLFLRGGLAGIFSKPPWFRAAPGTAPGTAATSTTSNKADDDV